ncbi:hypothetical protein [Azospirillum agricola]|uniref:hypothetical protein n=1 Tax=Azospirillum agricola TaxID=1720247 RepID=UPI000A0EF494|nr:hypothetical protein [Azospirillum agricola]SMH30573.1 hypothetical protein SAMN02982994_0337 [Azospirillum lipoferum]
MKPLLILGFAAGLFDDLAALGPIDADVMAVNRAGLVVGALDHWVSLHPDQLAGFARRRAADGLVGGFTTWAPDPSPGIDRVTADIERFGTSSLYAVRIALHQLGYRRVILAGAPLDDAQPYADGSPIPRRLGGHRPAWHHAAPEMAGRVRSLSGWTRSLLGAPTQAWWAP